MYSELMRYRKDGLLGRGVRLGEKNTKRTAASQRLTWAFVGNVNDGA